MVKINLNTESDTRPKKYTIENILDGKCDIILNTNIEEHAKEDESGETKTYFTYDMYRIEKNDYKDTLEEDLEDDDKFNMWLNFEKEENKNIHANAIREKRNTLLNLSDWTQANDTALSHEMVEKYRIYRQALRDITEQEGFPYDVEFPVEPVEENTEDIGERL